LEEAQSKAEFNLFIATFTSLTADFTDALLFSIDFEIEFLKSAQLELQSPKVHNQA
jgi:hypothetical protein